MTISDLQRLADGHGLKYFTAPNAPQLLAIFGGMFGNYQVTMTVQAEGEFLQFRTQGFASCAANHPNLTAVLRTLANLNFQRRLTKFGWDSNDGEIMAFADIWVMDGVVTQKMYDRMVAGFIPTIDIGYSRIMQALNTGADPGDEGALLGAAPPPGGPAGLLDKLKEILKGTPPPPAPGPGPITEI